MGTHEGPQDAGGRVLRDSCNSRWDRILTSCSHILSCILTSEPEQNSQKHTVKLTIEKMHFVFLILYQDFNLCLSVSVYLSVSVSLCFSLSLSLSVSVSVSVSLTVFSEHCSLEHIVSFSPEINKENRLKGNYIFGGITKLWNSGSQYY